MANKTTTWKGPGANYWLTTPSNPSGILTSPEADTQLEFDEWVASMDASYGSGGWGFSVAPSADPPPPAGAPPGMWTSDDDNGTFWQASGTTGPWKASDPFIGPGTNWGKPKDTYLDPALDPLTGDPSDLTDYQDFLAESEEGRRGLFGSGIRQQYPRGNPYRDWIESRFDPTQAQYNVEAGLGSTPPPSFREYSKTAAGKAFSPNIWRDYLNTASGLLTGGSKNLSQQQGDFREWLDEDATNQYDLALQSYLPRVAAPFRRAVQRRAGNVFDDFTIDQPSQSFLPWFVGRDHKFF